MTVHGTLQILQNQKNHTRPLRKHTQKWPQENKQKKNFEKKSASLPSKSISSPPSRPPPISTKKHTPLRLQLKRGLFWYRRYPKLHQMVKYGSSRDLVRTIRRQITLRVFFIRKNAEKWLYGPKNTKMLNFVKTFFEKLHASHQCWKKQMFPYNLLTIN